MTKSTNKLTHLGIIADGNRRWAKEQGLPITEGYKRAINIVEQLVAAAGEAGVDYVTFYVFSTENWGRSAEEVSYLMELLRTQILGYVKKLAERNAKFIVMGTHARLSEAVVRVLRQAEKMTAQNTGITVGFCFNYGGHQEVADAVNEIMAETKAANAVAAEMVATNADRDAVAADVAESEITPETIRAHLYHPEVPDVDLVVRTSGEKRLSGFMLWRAAYAELAFVDKYFPDLTAEDLHKIIAEFEGRERRFGK